MAERYAIVNGNANAPATWDGGVSVPAVGDDVFANGKTVTVNVNTTWKSVNTTPGVTAVAGGGFTLANGVTLTAKVFAGTTTCVTYSGTVGNSAFVVGDATGSPTTSAVRGVHNASTGTLNFTGNSLGGAAGNAPAVTNFSTGTLVFNGNPTGGPGANSHGIVNQTTGTVTITGTVTGGSVANSHGANNNAGGPMVINGNVIGGMTATSRGVNNNAGGSVTINGNAMGSPLDLGRGAVNIGAGSITVSGDAVGGNDLGAMGVSNGVSSTGIITVQGFALGSPTGSGRGVLGSTSFPIRIGKAKFGAAGASPYAGTVVFLDLATATIEVRDTALAARTLS